MAQYLVRGIDAKVAEQLKRQAKAHERSVEAEIREIIAESTRQTVEREQALKRGERLYRTLRRQGRKFSDSADLIREDRDR